MARLTYGVAASIAMMVAGCTGMSPTSTSAQGSSGMTFFITSTGSGKGADFGGLAGADRHCQTLAAAAGAGNHTWHAYVSTQGPGAVNARDRIGKGPWRNAKGEVVATSVEGTGTRTFRVRLQAGKTYRFLCDPHADEMRGSFTVPGRPVGIACNPSVGEGCYVLSE